MQNYQLPSLFRGSSGCYLIVNKNELSIFEFIDDELSFNSSYSYRGSFLNRKIEWTELFILQIDIARILVLCVCVLKADLSSNDSKGQAQRSLSKGRYVVKNEDWTTRRLESYFVYTFPSGSTSLLSSATI